MKKQSFPGGFTSDWEYNSTHDLNGKTYHIWQCSHREEYNAYQLTHQPKNVKLSYIKPTGTGHFVGESGLFNQMGIKVSPN